jgi:L-lactate dehydrogenase complex protein LldG
MIYDFIAQFTKLSGVAHRVVSLPAAAGKIAELCRARKAGCVALAGLPSALVAELASLCPEITLLNEPYDRAALPMAIDRADVGVTGIAFAIAQSGTMVEVADNDATRLVSSLPRVHIGVVREKDIIDQYFASAGRIRECFARHGSNLVLSFISGPSRTGDIELKLTLGVHGPEEVHCLIIAAAP